MATIALTKDAHDSVVNRDGIVLIDFWAEWCRPCRMFAPVFEKASEDHEDIVFAKVDTESERELAGMYGITSIPTLVAYRDGIPVFAQPGALPEATLLDLIGKIRDLDMDEVRKQVEQAS